MSREKLTRKGVKVYTKLSIVSSIFPRNISYLEALLILKSLLLVAWLTCVPNVLHFFAEKKHTLFGDLSPFDSIFDYFSS